LIFLGTLIGFGDGFGWFGGGVGFYFQAAGVFGQRRKGKQTCRKKQDTYFFVQTLHALIITGLPIEAILQLSWIKVL
jgi:hypothetical protein